MLEPISVVSSEEYLATSADANGTVCATAESRVEGARALQAISSHSQ